MQDTNDTMGLSVRENFLRNASFQGHEWIPQTVHIASAYWREAREELEDVCLRHPILFPGFKKRQVDFDGHVRSPEERRTVDAWGCEWEYELDGLEGLVVGHPLDDCAKFDSWSAPEPPAFGDAERERHR